MIEDIKKLIEQEINTTELRVDGDGSHFQVIVVSEQFEGLRAVKKQQMVYAAVNEHIASGDIHALTIKAYTPQEWEKAKLFV
ncbi:MULTISPECIES: BolA family protein [Kangiella]|uniref:Cell division protein BolA n=2 Tax=Kangiella TaxID=261963 RepID=A0A318D3F1_9GAMM|nr:BolA family protein [Kangiella spongicola]PXF63333.1 cell division protein BolA [Kangiella spongicola]